MFPLTPFILELFSEAHLSSEPRRAVQDGTVHKQRMCEQRFSKMNKMKSLLQKVAVGYSWLALAHES